MRPRPQALRVAALALCLLAALVAVSPRASTQRTGRRNAGVWDPAGKKAAPKPRRTPTPPRPAPRAARQLAVQYRLLKVNSDGSQVEVSPVTVFNAGDRVRVAVKSDEDVYLFVIHQKGAGLDGSIYIPDTSINGGQNFVRGGEQFVFPANCSGVTTPADCSYRIDAGRGQEFFTLIFSRSASVPVLERAVEAGGVVGRGTLEDQLGGMARRLDTSARGDTVFARRFRNLNPRSADMVVVRLVLNKRG